MEILECVCERVDSGTACKTSFRLPKTTDQGVIRKIIQSDPR